MLDVSTWLADHGFERFVDLFAENEVDGEVLCDLTDDHLKGMGIPLGPRMKLLKAISELREANIKASPTEAKASAPAHYSEHARRQLTLMFCDLVGSTELSGQVDPEEMQAIMGIYQDVCARMITRFDGYLAKFLGDGVLAYFGYPHAHENDA